MSHTSQSMSVSNSGFTPKNVSGAPEGGFGDLNQNAQSVLAFNNQIQYQAARENAMNPNGVQGQQ